MAQKHLPQDEVKSYGHYSPQVAIHKEDSKQVSPAFVSTLDDPLGSVEALPRTPN